MAGEPVETLRWEGGVDGRLVLIDQTELPSRLVYVTCENVDTVVEAIQRLRVRGAPAIGIAAAYAVVLGMRGADPRASDFDARFASVVRQLANSRPTAVNLFWALKRMKQGATELGTGDPADVAAGLLSLARAIHDEDRQNCRAIGRHGSTLLQGGGVLTHCNAGGLATSEFGTALGVIYAAQEQGKRLHVWVDETRPLLQGARLTAWELGQHGVPATLICDSMAAQVMREGRIQAVVVGADRIAANGDTANKIGTYGVAVLANAHNIPFYVAAPTSTFDLSLATGDAIPIEQRAAEEITEGLGRRTAPESIEVYNPAFDVTPARLITAIVCERGIIQPVNRERIATMVVPS